MGWSSPRSDTLNTGSCAALKNGAPREACPGWSSVSSLAAAYKSFLKWDMSVAPGMLPVEQAFWFSIRDSNNFGNQEHFGLCGSTGSSLGACEDSASKP